MKERSRSTVDSINSSVEKIGGLKEIILVPLVIGAALLSICMSCITITILIRVTWEICYFIATN